MALFLKRQGTIGLDIGKSSIIGVQVLGSFPSAVLKAYHERPLPEGLVSDGEVADPEGLAAELKAFMRESGIKGKLVELGIGNQKVIVRNIEVPEMDDEELKGAIEFQAQDYIPIPIEEVILDYQVVSRHKDEEGIGKQQVLLVAAQQGMIHGFLETAKKSGLHVAGIDVSAFALIRSLAPSVSFMEQTDGGLSLAIVNISSTVSTLVVATNDVPRFTRMFNVAYENFVRSLVDQMGILPVDALHLTERIGLAGPLPPDEETYASATIDLVHEGLGAVAEGLAEEIRRSLDYYQSQDYSTQIDRIILGGRGAMLRNLDHYLSDFLNVQVELGNPISKIAKNESGIPDDQLAILAPRLAVAIGLALDEVA